MSGQNRASRGKDCGTRRGATKIRGYEAKRNTLVHPLISDLATEVEDVLADGAAHLAAAGVDVGDGLRPGVGVGQGHVEDVALADVARDEEGGEDGQVGAGELEVLWGVMLASDTPGTYLWGRGGEGMGEGAG